MALHFPALLMTAWRKSIRVPSLIISGWDTRWPWLSGFRKSATARVHFRYHRAVDPVAEDRKKDPAKKSQRFLNETDLLEALADLQTRSQDIFGKT